MATQPQGLFFLFAFFRRLVAVRTHTAMIMVIVLVAAARTDLVEPVMAHSVKLISAFEGFYALLFRFAMHFRHLTAHIPVLFAHFRIIAIVIHFVFLGHGGIVTAVIILIVFAAFLTPFWIHSANLLHSILLKSPLVGSCYIL